MNRKMKVIKEYFQFIEIGCVYASGSDDLVYTKASGYEVSVLWSTHQSFDDAIDYLYDTAVRGGQPE